MRGPAPALDIPKVGLRGIREEFCDTSILIIPTIAT